MPRTPTVQCQVVLAVSESAENQARTIQTDFHGSFKLYPGTPHSHCSHRPMIPSAKPRRKNRNPRFASILRGQVRVTCGIQNQLRTNARQNLCQGHICSMCLPSCKVQMVKWYKLGLSGQQTVVKDNGRARSWNMANGPRWHHIGH